MNRTGYIGLMTIASLLMMLTNCQKKAEYSDASQIVERLYGHERFEQGQLKWQFHEVLGAEGPYTSEVNHDFRGSEGRLSSGQPGTFSVSNAGGTIENKYGGIEGTAFMAIPVQNRNLQNAVIVCRTVSAKESDAQSGPRE